jgi:hypothetical protein
VVHALTLGQHDDVVKEVEHLGRELEEPDQDSLSRDVARAARELGGVKFGSAVEPGGDLVGADDLGARQEHLAQRRAALSPAHMPLSTSLPTIVSEDLESPNTTRDKCPSRYLWAP